MKNDKENPQKESLPADEKIFERNLGCGCFTIIGIVLILLIFGDFEEIKEDKNRNWEEPKQTFRVDAEANVAAIERAAFQAERELRGYSGIADVSIQVSKDMDKTIVIALMVDEGIDKATALNLGETTIRRFSEHTVAEGAGTTRPSGNSYGSLFDEYNIYLGIFTYSTRHDKSKWYYDYVIIAGAHMRQGPGNPRWRKNKQKKNKALRERGIFSY